MSTNASVRPLFAPIRIRRRQIFRTMDGNRAQEIREAYYKADRIRLLALDDSDPVPVGSLGTVRAVRFLDGWMQIDVDWDNGRSLMLGVPPDRVAKADGQSS